MFAVANTRRLPGNKFAALAALKLQAWANGNRSSYQKVAGNGLGVLTLYVKRL